MTKNDEKSGKSAPGPKTGPGAKKRKKSRFLAKIEQFQAKKGQIWPKNGQIAKMACFAYDSPLFRPFFRP